MTIRKQHGKQTKFNAAIDLIKNEETIATLSQKYGIHQSILQRWKSTLLKEGPTIFEDRRRKKESSEKVDNYERKIGELIMELDFLKKALGQ